MVLKRVRKQSTMKLHWLLGLFSCLVVAKAQFSTSDQNRFAAKLYREASRLLPKNLVISPISVETVLALTQLGAQGQTADELRSALSLPDNQQQICDIFSTLTTNLNRHITFANGIFVHNDFKLNDDFVKNANSFFQAGVENFDFNKNGEAAQSINEWIEKQTNGKITNMIEPESLSAWTPIILLNALYFMVDWKIKFGQPSESIFHTSSSSTVQVPFMSQSSSYNYFFSPELNAEFLQLPYTDNSLSMVVVLPKNVDGLGELENNLESVFADKAWANTAVKVELPKFDIENKVQMKFILENMGVTKLFSESADLRGIGEGTLSVSNVVQKTFIRVNEDGTEAAAVTEVDIANRFGSDSVVSFVANHPFLFYIQSEETILFVGRYIGPDSGADSRTDTDPNSYVIHFPSN